MTETDSDATDQQQSPPPITGEPPHTADTELELGLKKTAATIDTDLLKAETYFDDDVPGSGVRLLTDGSEDPILVLGTVTSNGEEMTTYGILSLDQARKLGEVLIQHADTAEQRRAEKRAEERCSEEDSQGVLKQIVDTVSFGSDGDRA